MDIVENQVGVLVHFLHVLVNVKVAVLIHGQVNVEVVVVNMVLDAIVIVLKRSHAVLTPRSIQEQVEEEPLIKTVLDGAIRNILPEYLKLFQVFVVLGNKSRKVLAHVFHSHF